MKNLFASLGSSREKWAIKEREIMPGVHFFIIKFQKFLFPLF